MGIGVNVNIEEKVFPADIREIATSLQRETTQIISRHVLLRNILQQFEDLYNCIKVDGFDPVFAAWRNMNCTLGHEVSVSSANQQFIGMAIDIDAEGALLIEKQDGGLERVIAGDISVRRNLK
jgi:BirA family biotin operon repressor/biotin-[acetyl-CoA-carboxylase] ligase